MSGRAFRRLGNIRGTGTIFQKQGGRTVLGILGTHIRQIQIRNAIMYDTIIIGAGMSGLSAGCRLAHYDKKVCILEKHSLIGGLNSFYRQNGRNHDVGLHAVTNYAEKGGKRGPMNRLLRQLRLTWEELALVPQLGSKIAFPGVTLKFTNKFSCFEEQVAQYFPQEVDACLKAGRLQSDG